MLIGAGQRVYADGADLSSLLTGLKFESMTTVADATALSDAQRKRVNVGLFDSMLTLEGYYDPTGSGASRFRNYPTVNRLQYVPGDTVGTSALTFGMLRADKRDLPADTESLVMENLHFLGSSEVNTEWVYGGSVSIRNLNQGHSTPQQYVFGNPDVGVDFDNLNLDRQDHLGNPSGMEAFLHIHYFRASNSQNINFHVSSSNTRASLAWFNTAGFTAIVRNNANFDPNNTMHSTGTMFVNSGLTRRYYSPAVSVPGNVTLDLDFSVFYKAR